MEASEVGGSSRGFRQTGAMPWLAALGQAPDATDKVFALVGEKPAAVFWCCDTGETTLWRHLRGLNMARIPRWAAEGSITQPVENADARFETVMFRHWDPSVLGAIMPILDDQQFSRILGSAARLAFKSDDFGGAKRVDHDAVWRRPNPGPLTITSAQISALNDRRQSASHEQIADYLYLVASSEIGDATRPQVIEHVRISEVTGRTLGIATEAGHSRWSLMMLLTNGKIYQHGEARAFVAREGETPDEHVKELLTLTISAMRRGI